MAVIAFSLERAWVKAAWTVERVLADMLIVSPNGPHIRETLERAIAVNSLNSDFIQEQISGYLKRILQEVIAATIQGSESIGLKCGEGLDDNRQTHYKQALQELGELLMQQ
jgi:folate-dependent tRNA-U54 methylase TrmFO/GidA